MKVLFVSLPTGTQTVSVPLGIGYLSSMIKNVKGVEAGIVDMNLKKLSVSEAVRKSLIQKPDVICLSIFSNAFPQAISYCRSMRKENTSIKIILGGVHVTAFPELSLDMCLADVAIIGESEISFLELIEYFISKKKKKISNITGLVYRDSKKKKKVGYKKFTRTESRKLIPSLDIIPFPDWGLIPPSFYPPLPHNFFMKKYPFAAIVTTRGCPYSCDFCSAEVTWHRKIRLRSAKNVVDEIEMLMKKYGVSEIFFEDDNITLVKKHMKSICREILSRKLDIVWSCPNGIRLDTLDNEMISLMKESGCYSVCVGIESGSQLLVNSIEKHLSLKSVEKSVALLRKHKIHVTGMFIVGLPGENFKTVRETLRFAYRLKLDGANFAFFTPMPGAKLFTNYVKSVGGIEKVKWCDLNYHTPNALTQKENRRLKWYQRYLLYGFYFRPHIFIKTLMRIKFIQIPYFFRIIFDYF